MFGVLSVRKAFVLWQRCYVQLEEAEGVLRVASSPTSSHVEVIPLSEVELREPGPRKLSLVSTTGGRSTHLRADTPQQCSEWAAAISSVKAGHVELLLPGSPPVVRFSPFVCRLPSGRLPSKPSTRPCTAVSGAHHGRGGLRVSSTVTCENPSAVKFFRAWAVVGAVVASEGPAQGPTTSAPPVTTASRRQMVVVVWPGEGGLARPVILPE
eukprot:RCo039317